MPNWDHWKVLAGGIESWNEWRKKKPDVSPDLSAVSRQRMAYDLAKAINDSNVTFSTTRPCPVVHVGSVHLSRGNFANTDFSAIDLSDSTVAYADLRNARFRSSTLDRATLVHTDFRGARFDGVRLQGANLDYANLQGVDLRKANLCSSSLCRANLKNTNLSYGRLSGGTNLIEADLRYANLQNAYLMEADLSGANSTGADLRGANLTNAVLVETNFRDAKLNGTSVFGTSVWGCELDGADQRDIVISKNHTPTITVDNLDVAQFIYLLSDNEKIRDIIDTITSKVVLILGRFTPRQKKILDAIRNELRNERYEYVPVVFDFDQPTNRDIAETVTLLARMSRFVIADITKPRCIPQELTSIVKDLPSVPVQPILRRGAKPWAMFNHIRRYPWVLPLHIYASKKTLLGALQTKVVAPAEAASEAHRTGT